MAHKKCNKRMNNSDLLLLSNIITLFLYYDWLILLLFISYCFMFFLVYIF